MIKLKDLLKEGKLNEKTKVQRYVVGLENGEVMSGDKSVTEKRAVQIMSRISKRSDGWVNPFMIGVEAWNGTHPKSKGKPHKMNKKKIMVKEGKLNEFDAKMQKNHFLNLIKKEIDSLKGQIAYSNDKVNYKGTPDWEKKEFKGVLKDLKKKLKDTEKHYKRVQKLKEEKLTEAKESPIEVAKRIVKNKQHEKYKGMMLDLFTANAIVQVHDKVNDTMKKKLEKLPLPKLVTLVYKVMK